jgi:hypothetical protein
MTLKLGPIPDNKPVKISIEIPADVYRDLSAYAEAHASATGQTPSGPAKLIVPMISHFMSTDREFAKLRR